MRCSPDAWRSKGEFAPLLGHDIFLIDTRETSRPVLLLLHGYVTSSMDYSLIWDALHEHFRLITLDFLGLGHSAKPFPHAYRIMEQATIAEAVLDYCAVPHCHILAHDYGDSVAQELLARDSIRNNKRFLSATLLNGGLFPEAHRTRLIQSLMASWLGPWLIKAVSKRRLLSTFSRIFGPDTPPSDEVLNNTWALAAHDNGLRCLPGLLHYLKERQQNRERWVNALRETSSPLAIINGSADPISGAHMVARFREMVGDQHFICELPGIGHYPQIEAPDATLDAFFGFAREAGLLP